MSNFISLAKAKEMIAAFGRMRSEIFNPKFPTALPNSELFDREQFDKVLAKPDCKKLRIYYGFGQDQRLHAIIVGVNSEGKDLVAEETNTAMSTGTMSTTTNTATTDIQTSSDINTDPGTTTSEDIIEEGAPCPPYCPTTSPLLP